MILYFGNKLSKHGFTPTFIELLSPKLAEKYPVVSASDKKNKYIRFLHMIYVFFKFRTRTRLILIDTYSTSNFYYALAIAFLSRAFRLKYIPITRGGDLSSRLKNNPKLSHYVFGGALINISPSIYLEKIFRKFNYKIIYIPNSIPVDNYSFKLRENVAIKLLWVRSFHKIYNPELAIRVLNLLKPDFEDVQLCMVGPDKDGSLNNCQDLAKKLGLAADVHFTGQLSKAEWCRISENFDIFLNTTNFDNHPVSVIEAMALGLPVISTNVGGIPFLIQDQRNGLLVEQNDPNGFVDAIKILVNDDCLVERISKNARKEVECFDWEVVEKRWTNIIDKAFVE